MMKLRYVLLVFVLLGFAFLLTRQRIETKNHDLKIKTLQREIVGLESVKRDLILKIQKEKNRLNLMSLDKIGEPIALYDVVSVPVRQECPDVETKKTHLSSQPQQFFYVLSALFSRL